MKKFIIGGILISVFLAVVLSPFASSFPDGLEYVAEKFGFIQKDLGSLIPSPIPDYAVPFIGNEKLATSCAGFFGTIIAFVFAYGVGSLLKKQKRNG